MRNLTSSLRRSLWQITATVLMLGMANTAVNSTQRVTPSRPQVLSQ